MAYYHITSFSGWLAIKKEGIKSDAEGYIYVLDNSEVASYIASNQLGHKDYGLFEVHPAGIHVDIEPDLVGEITTKHQFRLKQQIIKPKHLKDLGMKKIVRS